MAQKPSIPQGTRDFSPIMVQRRKYILNTIEGVFKKYGFMPLETPTMENLTTLTGKYGDEGDQLLYKIINSGDYLKKLVEYQDKAFGHEEIDRTFLPSFDGKISNLDYKKALPWIAEKGLRYDLTVPFARYVSMNRNEITLPFKRYQMQPVWRADKPQKGRYREFWQCDADIIGSTSLLNEAELLKIYDEVFTLLNLPVVIKVNNRKLLSALATLINAPESFMAITMAIDKLDKIGEAGVKIELEKCGLNQTQIDQIISFLQISNSSLPLNDLEELFAGVEEGKIGVQELKTTFSFLGILHPLNPIKLDVTLARGLSYYTGAIVEVQAYSGSLKSSIGGGGRYDNLTGIFGLPGISGVGISFGLDRIADVLDELELFPNNLTACETKILFCYFDEESQIKAIELCAKVRNNGVAAEVYPDLTKKIGKQLDYANKLKITYACIIGSNEIASNKYVVKNLNSGEQKEMSPIELTQIN
ncbi:MAG: histidine--tRNA ligase [Bacteroidia bacterium]|nr:histidine--tRNA ligase [Bacteroidia bacterium]MCF8426737.1 histidine--tRNA ligase [Bacteroidia bacterium]MCF8446706.1 histidine--tRNA ligase [Bacteroidia bacterium]